MIGVKVIVMLFYWAAMYVLIMPFAWYFDLWYPLIPVAIFFGSFGAQIVNYFWKKEKQKEMEVLVDKVEKRYIDRRKSTAYMKSMKHKKR